MIWSPKWFHSSRAKTCQKFSWSILLNQKKSKKSKFSDSEKKRTRNQVRYRNLKSAREFRKNKGEILLDKIITHQIQIFIDQIEIQFEYILLSLCEKYSKQKLIEIFCFIVSLLNGDEVLRITKSLGRKYIFWTYCREASLIENFKISTIGNLIPCETCTQGKKEQSKPILSIYQGWSRENARKLRWYISSRGMLPIKKIVNMRTKWKNIIEN